jgi:hypothetical protein
MISAKNRILADEIKQSKIKMEQLIRNQEKISPTGKQAIYPMHVDYEK